MFIRFAMVLSFILSIAISTGCASQMPGLEAQELSVSPDAPKSVEITLDEIDDLSSDHYRALKVSFRNNTDQWLRLDSVNVQFPDFGGTPEVLLGSDLSSYFESVQQRNAVYVHNKKLAFGTLAAVALIGAGIGAHNDNAGLALAGLGLAGATVTVETVDRILASKDKAEFQSALPANHLLKPFDVAPKMAISRWIIVKLPESARVTVTQIALKEKEKSEARVFEVRKPETERNIRNRRLTQVGSRLPRP